MANANVDKITHHTSKILIIRMKALGDAIVTLPMVEEIERLYPHSQIDLIVDSHYAEIMMNSLPDINIISYQTDSISPIDWLRFIRSKQYEIVFDCLGSVRTQLWTIFSRAQFRVGFDVRLRSFGYNIKIKRGVKEGLRIKQFAGESVFDLLRAIEPKVQPWQTHNFQCNPDLVSNALTEWQTKHLSEKFIVGISMSATKPSKAWPIANWLELITLLESYGVRPVIITGPEDDKLINEIQLMGCKVLATPKTDLLELASLLSKMDLLISVDNGVKHLASTVGTPTIALFGATLPFNWTISSSWHKAVSAELACAPCNLAVCSVSGHPCMSNLSAETVFTEAKGFIGKIKEEQ